MCCLPTTRRTWAEPGWALELNAGAKYWKNDITLDYRVGLEDRPPLVEDQFSDTQT